ncbi:MAG: HAMP domain-containing histidine kinase [Actinobacteria bacterium]|nr:HAMP domain-containing histidine kinase [Actinomycetota bacterium]
MTLRTRLLFAAALSTAVLISVLAGVAVRQQKVLTDQLDDQLTRLDSNFGRFANLGNDTRDGRGTGDPFGDFDAERNPPLGEVFLAVIAGQDLVVIAAPASDPELRVNLSVDDIRDLTGTSEPFTIDVTGASGEARVVVARVDESVWVVAALSTQSVDDAQRQLLVTGAIALVLFVGALGLIMWWVDRLGIRPIVEVTKTAEDVAAGRTDRRVDHPPESTEAGRLGAAFNTMLDEREAVEARQRRFVADASHELRTPLTTLRGYTSLYAVGGLTEPEQVDDAMRRINNEASRMSALVDDLLTLAALDDQRPLHIATVDLSQLLHDIASDAHAVQPDRPIETDSIANGVLVDADAHQLTQALTTIVTNALRHTPSEAQLRLACSTKPGGVEISISDDGPGIESDKVALLFDRFYRADSGRSRDRGGSGLGLSIAKAIVEAHGGTIKIDSTIGQGTTVRIDLS